MLPPFGMVHWVWFFGVGGGSKSGGRSCRPSPQSPIGILGASSPFDGSYRTRQAKHNALKTKYFQTYYPGKKAMPRENFPGQSGCIR